MIPSFLVFVTRKLWIVSVFGESECSICESSLGDLFFGGPKPETKWDQWAPVLRPENGHGFWGQKTVTLRSGQTGGVPVVTKSGARFWPQKWPECLGATA